MDLTTSEKDFDECFKIYGGVLRKDSKEWNVVSPYIIRARADIEFYRTNRPELPDVYIDAIHNFSINAKVTKTDKGYFIGVYLGAFFCVKQLFLRMMANKNILPNWGDTSHEVEHEKMFNAQVLDVESLLNTMPTNDSGSIKTAMPIHDSRLTMADVLTAFATRFLVLHEYGHIIFGHIELLSTLSNAPQSFQEFDIDHSKTPFTSDLSQTLELDADSFATYVSFKWVLQLSMSKQFDLFGQTKSFDDVQKMWFFSIYSFFRIFGYWNLDVSKIKSSTHPLSGIRQNIAFRTAQATIEHLGGIRFKEVENPLDHPIDKLVIETINSVESAFSHISQVGIDTSAIMIGLSNEGREHMMFLIKNWNNVRPLLEPYATGKLAPLWEERKNSLG